MSTGEYLVGCRDEILVFRKLAIEDPNTALSNAAGVFTAAMGDIPQSEPIRAQA